MSKRAARLTTEQRQDLMRMARDGRFTLTKAGRVLGFHLERLKNMIEREGPEFYEAMLEGFPGALANEKELEFDWGPKTIPYEQLGPVPVPVTVISHRLAFCQPWIRSAGAHRGA